MVNDYKWLLPSYAQDVNNLNDPDGLGTDEEIVVLRRESIAKHLWTKEELREIARIDDLLLAHWQQFEGVLPNPNFQDRSHWWWFLHEGPQVREQAERLAPVAK